MNGQAWTTAEQFDAMDASTDQSFGDLINFDHLDLDLSEFAYNNGDYSQTESTPLSDLPASLHDYQQQQQHQHQQQQQQQRQQHHNATPGSMSQPANGFSFDYSMGQYSQAGTSVFPNAQDQIYRPHHGVPPTPNSVEMHGDPHRYMQHIDTQQAFFDGRYHMRKDDAVCSTVTAL